MEEITEDKQKLLLEYAYSNFDVFIKVNHVIKPDYYEKPLDRVVKFVHSYFNDYHSLPNFDIVKVETGVGLINRQTLDEADKEFAIKSIGNACKRAAMTEAILQSADSINESEEETDIDFSDIEGKIRTALSVSIDRDLGLDQFLDVAERIERMKLRIASRSSGYILIDELIDEIRRGEMIIFAANSGGGKSLVLGNIGVNMVQAGLHVVYISFELDQDLLAKRFDSMITGIPYKDLFEKEEEICSIYESLVESGYGSLITKKLPPKTTASKLRTYLSEYQLMYQRNPDVILVDYLDLMAPNENNKNHNRFDIDKDIAEELRDVFVDFNAYGFTASQLNRDAVDVAIKSQAHIAGGMSKINTADTAIAINRTQEQIDKNEIEFQALKLRNTTMKTYPVVLHLQPDTLRIVEKAVAKKQTSSLSQMIKNRPPATTPPVSAPPANKQPEANAGHKKLMELFGKRE